MTKMSKLLGNFGLENPFSEVDLLVMEDDNFRNSHKERKMNRAARRHNTAAKKHNLGKKWKYANEQIDAYWVEKVGDKKVTHWVGDSSKCNGLPLEEHQKYWNEIPWNKVKACNFEKFGYKYYASGKDPVRSRKVRYEKLPDVGEFYEAPDFWDWYMKNKDKFAGWDLYDGLPYSEDDMFFEAMGYFVENISHEDLVDKDTGEVVVKYTPLFDYDDFWWRQYIDKNWRMVDSDNGEIVVHDRGNYCNSLEEDDRVYLQFHAARRMMRNRIGEIEAEKVRLLEEYADKIEALNKEIRVLKGM